ncbi:hypothetical protein FZH48_25400 [Salmonella enterica]|nr:hypothetical protein [Salmonella enterica]ECI4531052.1 hypothetical protein [Salmonella enterica subsp. diarizonae]EAX5861887.1 hypothetical protein [Salmonella enterica]EBD6545164.1 hypothetical protein [Salmonella enterica]EBJ7482513.1 hypothetical protein [Salmonella enterica]
MNKSISGLAMILITSGTAHAAGVLAVNHDSAYENQQATVEISGSVITTEQDPPISIIFTPQTLLSKAAFQIAAVATVSRTHVGSEYVLGSLIATGDDSAGYVQDTTSSWITTAPDARLTGTNRAIVSDGTPFYVNIVHKNSLPKPGTTLLRLPLTEYKK